MSVSTHIEKWIGSMMKEMGVKNYKIKLSNSSCTGEGHLGDVNFVKVVILGEVELVMDLVVKSAKKGEVFRKKTAIGESYDREMTMYTKIFPEFIKFQKEQKIEEKFLKFPKLYFAINEPNNEAIILKNLQPEGYRVHDRNSPQNFQHVNFIFENYAKLHGISLAMKIKKPEIFKNLSECTKNVFGKYFKASGLWKMSYDDFCGIIEVLRKCDKVKVADKMVKVSESIEEVLTNYNGDDNELAVILHGDCWNSNFLFKYEDEDKSKPIDICFVDYQFSRFGSIIFDLSYCLYTVANKPTLDKFDDLIQNYHNTLIKFLKQFNINREVISLKELKDNWKLHGRFGLAMAPFIVKVALSENDDYLDIAECAEKSNFINAFKVYPKDKNKELYESWMMDIMEHFAGFC